MAKLIILHISPLISFILTLRVLLVAMLVISGILSSISLILALYKSFLTTSFFTTSLISLKSTGTAFNLSTSNSDNSSIPNLLTPDFRVAKSSFLANRNASTPVAFFKSHYLSHN